MESVPEMTESSLKSSSLDEDVVNILDPDGQGSVPIDLHVQRLNYTVTDKPGSWWQYITNLQMPWEWMEPGSTKHILQDVSFTAKSGQLMAIMGGSGSGKTSLLDVIACRVQSGSITGDVYLNTVARTKPVLDACAGYVRQDDRLMATLTVRETLMFVAQLKLPKSFSKAEVRERVDGVISELGLKHAADTKVGNENIRGLSGGERRRVSIGIQLILMPSLLLLDEPTSGLDSYTANNMVHTLSKLALNQRTVLMTIHQPRFDIFEIVDVMMILSRGSIIYNGPAKEMVSYFTTLGFPCPELTNPCDYYIDLCTVDRVTRASEEKSLQTVHNLNEAYKAAESASALTMSRETLISSMKEDSGMGVDVILQGTPAHKDTYKKLLKALDRTKHTPGIFIQFLTVFKRFIRVTVDDYQSLLTHCILAICMSMLLGITYVDLKLDQLSVRDWFGVMFMMSVMYPYMVILGLIGNCHDERRFLYFELQDRLYCPSAYYFAKIFSDIPFHLLYVLLYCIPVYAMAGLPVDAYKGFLFYVFASLSVFTSRCLAMMAATILPTYALSCVTVQIIFSIYLMCAGFFINIKNIIIETQWISTISYLRWGFEALCLIEIKDLTFECDSQSSCVPTGEVALDTFSFGGDELWHCTIGLFSSIVVYLGLMFVGLKFIPQKPNENL